MHGHYIFADSLTRTATADRFSEQSLPDRRRKFALNGKFDDRYSVEESVCWRGFRGKHVLVLHVLRN